MPTLEQTVNAQAAVDACPHLTVDPALRICGGCGQYFPSDDESLFEYVGGMAGTGKTWMMKRRVEGDPRVQLLATTGIAAVNLGGARTINSVLRYYDTADMQGKFITGGLTSALFLQARSGYTRLVIDEVSMMDGWQLDCLVAAVDQVNERLEKQSEPLMGITLVGDFAQLPPVDAPFVFEQTSWDRFKDHVTILRDIKRQVDPVFIQGLLAARAGNTVATMHAFRRYFRPTIDLNYDGTTILATNAEVDRMNGLRLLRVQAPDHYLPSYRVGQYDAGWKNIPERLQLRVGALVMILRNKTEGGSITYANGDLAIIEDIHPPDRQLPPEMPGQNPELWEVGHVTVRLLRNDHTVEVDPITTERTEATGYKGVKKDRSNVIGWCKYMPLRVAYATTVHKSQGLTLDRVQLDLGHHFWTTPGMVYVALSRARTLDHLTIAGRPDLLVTRLRINEKVREWI